MELKEVLSGCCAAYETQDHAINRNTKEDLNTVIPLTICIALQVYLQPITACDS